MYCVLLVVKTDANLIKSLTRLHIVIIATLASSMRVTDTEMRPVDDVGLHDPPSTLFPSLLEETNGRRLLVFSCSTFSIVILVKLTYLSFRIGVTLPSMTMLVRCHCRTRVNDDV